MTSNDAVQIRQMRRSRVRMIRGRVIGYSVALFVVLWSLIAVLLVTGHDPALSSHPTASASTGSAAPTGASAEDSGSDDSGSFSSAGSSNSAGTSSAGSSNSTGSSGFVSPSPVTSSQS